MAHDIASSGVQDFDTVDFTDIAKDTSGTAAAATETAAPLTGGLEGESDDSTLVAAAGMASTLGLGLGLGLETEGGESLSDADGFELNTSGLEGEGFGEAPGLAPIFDASLAVTDGGSAGSVAAMAASDSSWLDDYTSGPAVQPVIDGSMHMAMCGCPACGDDWQGSGQDPVSGGSPVENGTGDPTATVAYSGTNYIDGVLWGTRWTDGFITYSDPDSMADYQAGYSGGSGQPNYAVGFGQLTANQLMAAHQILNQAVYTQPAAAAGLSVEAFTNLGIDYAGTGTGNSTLRLANTSSSIVGTARVADFPGGSISGNPIYGGDVWYGGSGDFPTVGNYDYATTIHELGHALGLKHGHQASNHYGGGAPVLPTSSDSMEYSIMTYRSYVGHPASGYTNETWGYAQTFMMYDIAALQYLYGADFGANAGNTVYSWSPTSGNTLINGNIALQPGGNRIFATIWDGNGIDTYDLSAYSTGVTVRLSPGSYSVFSQTQLADLNQFSSNPDYLARGNIFNALQYNGDARSLIENAIGGSGDDSLYGNAANNSLEGNAGNDYLSAGSGNDTLVGGSGQDTAYGSSGNDTFIDLNGMGSGDDDYYSGGSGTDTLIHDLNWVSGVHFDLASGWSTFGGNRDQLVSIENLVIGGSAQVTGSSANNHITINGSGGNVIDAGEGEDTVLAGGGDDTITDSQSMFSNGDEDDVYNGGAGTDTLIHDRTWVSSVHFDLASGFTTFGGNRDQLISIENLVIGGSAQVTGSSAANHITVNGSGANVINAGSGQDTVLAGGGNDTITDTQSMGASNDDVYDGGAGTDTLIHDLTWVSSVHFDLGSGWTYLSGGQRDQLISIENLVVGGDAQVTGSSGANVLTVNGSGDNVIDGAGGADTIDAGGGNDTITGHGDLEVIDAGSGDDLVLSGLGGETMEGGAGIDTIDHRAFNGTYIFDMGTGLTNYGNEIYTNFENVFMGNGGDSVTGSAVDNVIDAGGGNDTVFGGDGADSILGGDGDDDLYGADSGSSAYYGDDDTLRGGAGDDTLFYNQTSTGNGGNVFDGGADTDTFEFTSDFSRVIDLEAGEFRLGISPGSSVRGTLTSIENVTVHNASTVIGDGGANVITALGAFANDIDAGGGDDWVDAGDGNDTVNGRNGDDTVFGGAGDDSLIGGALGDDYLSGDAGNDTLIGGNGLDTLVGGDGDDSLLGGAAVDTLNGGAGADTLDGGVSNDTAVYGSSSAAVDVRLINGFANGGDATGDVLISIENLYGSSYNDLLVGDNNDNLLAGGGGHDDLRGGNGQDTLLGGGGQDSMNGGGGADYMEGGAGGDSYNGGNSSDTVSYESSNAAVDVRLITGFASGGHANGDSFVDVENLVGSAYDDLLIGDNAGNVLEGGAGDDDLRGGNNDDTLIGGAGNDSLNGGANNDVLEGGAGADELNGANSNDTAVYTSSNAAVDVRLINGFANGGHATGDTIISIENLGGSAYGDLLVGSNAANILSGGGGDDELRGGNGADELYGDDGDDLLRGGVRADTLVGGAGDDTLNGGFGLDVFVFHEGDDVIEDFVNDFDTILVDDANWAGVKSVAQVIADHASVVGSDTVLNFALTGYSLTIQGLTTPNDLLDDLLII